MKSLHYKWLHYLHFNSCSCKNNKAKEVNKMVLTLSLSTALRFILYK